MVRAAIICLGIVSSVISANAEPTSFRGIVLGMSMIDVADALPGRFKLEGDEAIDTQDPAKLTCARFSVEGGKVGSAEFMPCFFELDTLIPGAEFADRLADAYSVRRFQLSHEKGWWAHQGMMSVYTGYTPNGEKLVVQESPWPAVTVTKRRGAF